MCPTSNLGFCIAWPLTIVSIFFFLCLVSFILSLFLFLLCFIFCGVWLLYLFSIQVDEVLRYASVHCVFILKAEKAKPCRRNVTHCTSRAKKWRFLFFCCSFHFAHMQFKDYSFKSSFIYWFDQFTLSLPNFDHC